MYKRENNFTFVDFQNLIKGVYYCGWEIDFYKLFDYLSNKYKSVENFLFIGYMEENKRLYDELIKIGYKIVFKEAVYLHHKLKANVDVDLAVTVMLNLESFDKAVIVSGDGDFKILVDLLISKDKLRIIIVPNMKKASVLLKKSARGNITDMNSIRTIAGKIVNEKGPHGDAPA